MKKILVVNDNLNIGGIQKSLLNFLKSESKSYDITLALFNNDSVNIDEIPKDVKRIYLKKCYKILGETKQNLWKNEKGLFFLKALLLIITKLTSRKTAMKILGFFQKKIKGYDIVISFSHSRTPKDLGGGVPEFVIDKTVSPLKICYIHCDYKNSDTCCKYNNLLYSRFDKIFCCSNSVRSNFLDMLPELKNKTKVVRNFYDLDIINYSNQNNVQFDSKYINFITVARLSQEKGINEALLAIGKSERDDIFYHIVGDGPERSNLVGLANELGITDRVTFWGEQKNPFAFMANADYLIVSSYHEAAPMVFDEARMLGLRIISSNTTSAKEMLTSEDFIYNNNQELQTFLSTLKKPNEKSIHKIFDNTFPKDQFTKSITG